MIWVDIQFGAGGVSVQRQFAIPPRVGDFLTVDRDGEIFHLRVDMASFSENREKGHEMEYFVHAAVLDDWGEEATRATQAARER